MARIAKKIHEMKNWKIFIICLLLTITCFPSIFALFFAVVELLTKTPVFILSNKNFAQILIGTDSDQLLLGYLLDNNFNAIQIVAIHALFIFFSLLGCYILSYKDNDIQKLPEIAIPEAKKFINEYPKANSILTPLIQEAESKDDGEKLRKILMEFYKLRNLENNPEYWNKKAEEEIKKAKEEETRLKKKLGLS